MGPQGKLILHRRADREAECNSFDTIDTTDEWTMDGQTAWISIWRTPLHAMI
ncbi:hypothetical protein ACPMJQ_30060 [Streptomyces pseudogriseolus]|uniref:Uncharacterized protein n=1 Tax=Streptomyces sp. R02 TaxID=3238623 RepID=A0AB39LVG9_9ACTN